MVSYSFTLYLYFNKRNKSILNLLLSLEFLKVVKAEVDVAEVELAGVIAVKVSGAEAEVEVIGAEAEVEVIGAEAEVEVIGAEAEVEVTEAEAEVEVTGAEAEVEVTGAIVEAVTGTVKVEV